jgi:hypothetical protein
METMDEGRLLASMDLICRTGAAESQLRYSDDEQPCVWLAVAKYRDGRWETAAGHEPVEAALRLAELLVDGGQCTHCKRPTALEAGDAATFLDKALCWYIYDPELKTFRRSCEDPDGP